MNWFRFNKSWFENKRKYDILYTSYDELINNKSLVIDKFAKFLDIYINSFDPQIILEKSSFEYMKANEKKFGEKPEKKPDRIYNEFIRKGVSGGGKELLNADQTSFFEAQMELELSKMIQEKLS